MEQPKQPVTALPFTEDQIKALIELYRKKRVEVQYRFYLDRIAEYDYNASRTGLASVILVAVAGLAATINSILDTPSGFLGAVAVLLPVFAAFLASFEKIYGWDRQKNIYEGAAKRLEDNNTIPPAPVRNPPKPEQPYASIYIDFVTAVENTLKSEMEQWGKAVLENKQNQEGYSAGQELESVLSKMEKLDPKVKQQILNLAKGKPQAEGESSET